MSNHVQIEDLGMELFVTVSPIKLIFVRDSSKGTAVGIIISDEEAKAIGNLLLHGDTEGSKN